MRAVPWLGLSVGYLATYFLSTALPTPLLWHLPVERRFTFAVHPVALGADFYGRLLLSLAVGALTGAGASRLRARKGWLPLLIAWTAGLLLFTAGLYVDTLAARQPIAAPLPDGYVPR